MLPAILLGDQGNWWTSPLLPPDSPLHVSSVSPWKELVHMLVPQFLLCCPRDGFLGCLALIAIGLPFVVQQAKKRLWTGARAPLFHNYIHEPNAERAGKKKPFSQFLPGKGLTTYFPSCFLRVQLPISLRLGTEWDPHLWNTVGSWQTLNYWEPLTTKEMSWMITDIGETTES